MSERAITELVGRRCAIVFVAAEEWPIPGYPAWATVLAIDPPLMKLDYGGGLWINMGLIKTIVPVP